MFNFEKTYQFSSSAYPGVVVTLRRIGPQKRAEIEMSIADIRMKQRELATKEEALGLKLKAILDRCVKDAEGNVSEAEVPEEAFGPALELQAARIAYAELNRSHIDPAFLRAGVKSVSGLTYEGQPATADLICDFGPDELFDEITREIGRNLRLTAEQARNLQSPSTLSAQGDGTAETSTATSANPSADTSGGIAGSTSPST